MIRDQELLEEIRSSWPLLRASQAVARVVVDESDLAVGRAMEDVTDSLALVFAYSLLHHVLTQLRDEGAFEETTSRLESLMRSSRTSLPWQKFALVDEGRRRRAEIAHATNAPTDCKRYIDAIEAELAAWGVLEGRTVATHATAK